MKNEPIHRANARSLEERINGDERERNAKGKIEPIMTKKKD